MPTRVWLMRHAETASPEVFHGAESDVGLGERGRRQAAAVAPWFAARQPDAVVSSAMRRARETAGPIAAACGLPLRLEQDLHERRVGALSGTRVLTDQGVWPDTLARWLAGETAHAPPGAESYDDVRRRVLPVWERLTAELAGRKVVIVAHGVVCRVLILNLLDGWSVADWKRIGPIPNLSVSELLGGAGRWRAERLNQVPELPGPRAEG
jgi:broad specificity phosphatase PhoE